MSAFRYVQEYSGDLGWSYLCAMLQDTTTSQRLEYCFRVWRSWSGPAYDAPIVFYDPQIGILGTGFTAIVSDLTAAGTRYAQNWNGATTVRGTQPSGKTYSGAITRSHLVNATNDANAQRSSRRTWGRALACSPVCGATRPIPHSTPYWAWRTVSSLSAAKRRTSAGTPAGCGCIRIIEGEVDAPPRRGRARRRRHGARAVRSLLADEKRATSELHEPRGSSTTRASGPQEERASLRRIFHCQQQAALDQHVAGHQRALAYWQDQVALSEEQLGAALESRESWLAEHGETTLELLRIEGERDACELFELREEVIARRRSVLRASWRTATRTRGPTSRATTRKAATGRARPRPSSRPRLIERRRSSESADPRVSRAADPNPPRRVPTRSSRPPRRPPPRE